MLLTEVGSPLVWIGKLESVLLLFREVESDWDTLSRGCFCLSEFGVLCRCAADSETF